MFLRFIVSLAVGFAFVQAIAAATRPAFKPVPNWVRKVVPATDLTKVSAQPGTTSTQILNDQQIKVGSNSVERYYHYYQRVDNTAGLDDLSQLRLYFEPSYQQLAIHFVRVLRGGTTINAFNPSEVKTIQEESELDQQLYNGTSAAVIFVNDIRVGDIVEYAYTVTGDNPVLGGRYTETIYLGDTDPIEENFLRLLFPSKRALYIKNDNTKLEPTKQQLGEDTEYVWYSKNVEPVSVDDSLPDWFNPYPRIILSEFHTWADVVNWALPMYQNSSLNSAELKAKIESWKKNSAAPEHRTITALRFVQDEIRYLGIELGEYSHQPTTPEKVFARRFGDCKDKSLLLSSILNAMGIEAAPALVSTSETAALDDWQATPFAFDHVIVQAKLNGKTYWLDPTISYQRGGLETYYDPPYLRSLVLKPGETDLQKIPEPKNGSGSIEILESYTGENAYASVTLDVTKTYKGKEADEMRYSLSTSSLTDISKSHLNYYADTTPSITANGLPVVDDNESTNTIVIKEKYLISDLWKENRHSFGADRIYAELRKPHVSQRDTPIEVNYPLSIKQTILINLGPGYEFPSASDVLTDDSMRFEYSYSKNGNQMSMYFTLNTFKDSVPPTGVQRHLELLDKAQSVAGFELNRGRTALLMPGPERPSRILIGLTWLVILIPVALFVIWLIRARVQKGRRTQFVEQMKVRPGTSPETALRMATNEQLESTLSNFSCRCGGRPNPDIPVKRERFMYDGQRLLGVRLLCSACKQNTDLYINPLFENDGDGLANLSTS